MIICPVCKSNNIHWVDVFDRGDSHGNGQQEKPLLKYCYCGECGVMFRDTTRSSPEFM